MYIVRINWGKCERSRMRIGVNSEVNRCAKLGNMREGNNEYRGE